MGSASSMVAFSRSMGGSTGHLFLTTVPFAVIALVRVLFIREVALRTTVEREDEILAKEVQPA